MTTSSEKEVPPDVPVHVFEKFVQALGEAKAPAELVVRLRKVLLEERTFTERALKTAILGEEKLL